MVKKIIILGATGFIGPNLLKNFSIDASCDVKGYSSEECDLLSLDSVTKALSKTTPQDVIIMVSAITRLKENSPNSMAKNLLMAENLSKFIKNHPINQLIFLSTIDVYGYIEKNVIIDEKLSPKPISYYAKSKLDSEFILKKVCSENNISLTILRLPGVYGPGDTGISTISQLVESAIKGKVIIYGNNKRDYIHVDDLYKIIKLAINQKTNLTLNIATGKSYTIQNIVKMIKLSLSKEFLVEFEPKEGYDLIFDTSLLKKTFPTFKFIDIKKGLKIR